MVSGSSPGALLRNVSGESRVLLYGHKFMSGTTLGPLAFLQVLLRSLGSVFFP